MENKYPLSPKSFGRIKGKPHFTDCIWKNLKASLYEFSIQKAFEKYPADRV